MALDPKKWTVKTQEAFAAAIDLAKSRHNPELTPDHLLVALADQDGTVIAPVLAKLGQSPGMVRDKALAAVDRLPSAIGGDEPRLGRELNAVAERASALAEPVPAALPVTLPAIKPVLMLPAPVEDPMIAAIRALALEQRQAELVPAEGAA